MTNPPNNPDTPDTSDMTTPTGSIEAMTQETPVNKNRRVGILGDSISTYEGTMCNELYTPYYPLKDPNASNNPSIAVDSREKTWWWRLIYYYLPNAELDANSSWAGGGAEVLDAAGGRTKFRPRLAA